MPDTHAFDVTVTAGYEIGAACEFDAVLRVVEALRTGGMPWPVTLMIEVSENA